MSRLHTLTLLVSFLLPLVSSAQTQKVATVTLTSLNKPATSASAISIHDPSIVLQDGQYTIWGSHRGLAQSTDLIDWTPLPTGPNSFIRLTQPGSSAGTSCDQRTAFNIQQVTRIRNYQGTEVDFPNIDAEVYCARYAPDAESWIDGNMWAPDIIYNTTMKKWCMYLSLNGDNWSSVIVLLTATSPTGPFTYQGPVVMGGFTGQKYNGVAAPAIGETDYTIATGETTLPARYLQTENGTYWPNCIDPCVFYDEEGELWLTYGSWSGGIFMLKLDKTNGLRDYTYTYPSDYATKGASGTSDPYYGKKIAGGYYVSGEGPYIQHIGHHYYLFMSYGGFDPNGGYEMRIFRSEHPDGPYTDAMGNLATYTNYQLNYGPNAVTNRGMKLMGAYNEWGNVQEVGECAQGHNSAVVDPQGRAFVVYHTKFNDGTLGHQVRIHQLFLNQDGWLVAAPFCYQGETLTDSDIATSCPWDDATIAGEYQVMIHPYKLKHQEYEEVIPSTIQLTTDGKVTGDLSGTWAHTEGTSYITLYIKQGTTSIAYKGVLCEQRLNGATKQGYKVHPYSAICFTAVSTSGVPFWGEKLSPVSAIAHTYSATRTTPVKTNTSYASNLNLTYPTTDGVKLQWLSTAPEVMSETGKYNPTGLTAATPLTLTEQLICGDYYWEKEYNIKAAPETTPDGDCRTGIVAYYDMDEGTFPVRNAYDDAQKSTHSTSYRPTFITDLNRFGQQLHLGFGAQGSNCYIRLNNPLFGQSSMTGFTVSAWVLRSDDNHYDALWSFFGSANAKAEGPRLFLTGNDYVAYNDNAGTWFDINHPNTPTTDIPIGTWSLITVTIGPEGGVRTYVNGKQVKYTTLAADAATAASLTGSTTAEQAASLPAEKVVSQVAQLSYFFLGSGSFWGSPDCTFDDLLIWNRELTATDVKALNTLSNRVTNFGPLPPTSVELVEASRRSQMSATTLYDLSGRRSSALRKGIYIQGGKKIVK